MNQPRSSNTTSRRLSKKDQQHVSLVDFGQSLLRHTGHDPFAGENVSLVAEVGFLRVSPTSSDSIPGEYQAEGSMAILVHRQGQPSKVLWGPGLIKQDQIQPVLMRDPSEVLLRHDWPGLGSTGMELYAIRVKPTERPNEFIYVAARQIKPGIAHRWQPLSAEQGDTMGAFEDDEHLFHVFTPQGVQRIPSPAPSSLTWPTLAQCLSLPMWGAGLDDKGALCDLGVLTWGPTNTPTQSSSPKPR